VQLRVAVLQTLCAEDDEQHWLFVETGIEAFFFFKKKLEAK
jgi:hypothetical protein